jgi:3-oxoacyl-[acyl-carrier protein] reductase
MGRATAMLFAQEGARVAVAARDPHKGAETVRQIRAAGGEGIAQAADLTDRKAVDALVEGIVERWGRLDILYYGAGGFFNPGMTFEKMEHHNEPFWQLAISNTLDGLYNLAQACRPHLRGGGAIVTVAASFSVRQEGNPAYGTAKAGVIGMTQSLAKAFYPDQIRVNCIGSGLIRAALGEVARIEPVAGLQRTGHPEDIAYTALYLAGPESSWVTGQVLNVDGGVDAGARPLWAFEK